MSELNGKTVFVVEDDVLLAADLIQTLEEAGADVIGPARTLEFAQAALGRQQVDAAILDVELLDGTVFEIASSLRDRGVPFVFYTSHASDGEARVRAEGAPLIGKDRTSREAVLILSSMLEAEAAE